MDELWLAGLLEGEGSFLKGPPSRPNAPIVKLEMKDEDVVLRAAELMGATSCSTAKRDNPKWSTTYIISVRGSRAIALMRRLRPHMGLRRQAQIDAAIGSHRDWTKDPDYKRYEWPSDAKLLSLRSRLGWRPLAQKLGVSFTAVRRRVARIEART